jgi:PEP-CTERM motif
MSKSRVKSVFLGAAFSVAAIVGVAGPAEAAVYNGSWDPAYGAPFPNLYWKAEGTFFIPDACLASGDGTFGAGACVGLDITSMTLGFYQNAGGSPGALLESFALNTAGVINSYVISNHQFTGINTNYFAPVTGTVPQAGSGDYGFSLVLYNNTLAQLEYFTPATQSTLCLPGSSANFCGFSANAAVGTITPAIPEPGTYALLAGGLVAIGFGVRRRRR